MILLIWNRNPAQSIAQLEKRTRNCLSLHIYIFVLSKPFLLYPRGVQLAAVNYNSPSEALSTFSTSKSQQSLDRSPHSSIHESESLHYSNASTAKLGESNVELRKDAEETRANGAPWIRRPGSPANSEEK